MAYNNPSVADFKAFFERDFPYGTDINTSVTDSDITKAFLFTNAAINSGFFNDQGQYTIGYLLLTAHNLVTNITSGAGFSGSFSFLTQSQSVGSVSASYVVPQRILDSPQWAMYFRTNYGAQYMDMIMSQLAGAVFTVAGSTRP